MRTGTKKNEDDVVDGLSWVYFWGKLKLENPDIFKTIDEKLTDFVDRYPKEIKYLTVEDVVARLKEI